MVIGSYYLVVLATPGYDKVIIIVTNLGFGCFGLILTTVPISEVENGGRGITAERYIHYTTNNSDR